MEGRAMKIESDALGAAGAATRDESQTGQASLADSCLRKEWTISAWMALENCNPRDAAQICATFLAESETGGPLMGDLLGMVTGDALFWADCAPAHELVAYGTAALDQLRGQALGLDTRKHLFSRLWESFDPKVRRAFLARVDAEGRFLRKGAA
jgi:hypothetical protein